MCFIWLHSATYRAISVSIIIKWHLSHRLLFWQYFDALILEHGNNECFLFYFFCADNHSWRFEEVEEEIFGRSNQRHSCGPWWRLHHNKIQREKHWILDFPLPFRISCGNWNGLGIESGRVLWRRWISKKCPENI